jgi:RNA polymerase-interacting CarD/CdnL/TRCF family regulator
MINNNKRRDLENNNKINKTDLIKTINNKDFKMINKTNRRDSENNNKINKTDLIKMTKMINNKE